MGKIAKNEHGVLRSRSWMKYICHQRPNRCFKINGRPMAICSRCFGVYLGLGIGLVIPIMIQLIYLININILFLLMIMGITPLALDGVTQFLGLRESNNYLRFSSGFIAGFFLGVMFNWLVVHILL